MTDTTAAPLRRCPQCAQPEHGTAACGTFIPMVVETAEDWRARALRAEEALEAVMVLVSSAPKSSSPYSTLIDAIGRVASTDEPLPQACESSPGNDEEGWWVETLCMKHDCYHLQYRDDGTRYRFKTWQDACTAADALNESGAVFTEARAARTTGGGPSDE